VAIDLETWLTRFAAGAATAFQWRLDAGRIVAESSEEDPLVYGDMCPISAQATLETGKVYLAEDAPEARQQQGLSSAEANALMDAADYRAAHFIGGPSHARLRARLLRICHLEEEAQWQLISRRG
jgi:hypothetical protein